MTGVNEKAGESTNNIKTKMFTDVMAVNLPGREKEFDILLSKAYRTPISHDWKTAARYFTVKIPEI